MVRISDVRLQAQGRRQVLCGRIDGEELYFDCSLELALGARGEPFLAIGLFKAMAAGEPLTFCPDVPLDPALTSTLPTIQAILQQWNPKLTPIEVHVDKQASAARNPGILASFSGGVDSTSTLMHHQDEITHLMTLNSFDGSSSGGGFQPLRSKVDALASLLDKKLIDIETNAHIVITRLQMNWSYVHGPLLCLLAGSMGFSRFYIPSSGTYENLKPWGSHPVLDYLWSTSETEVVHDGAGHRRTEKILGFARRPELLEQLQVCWRSQTENCGDCPKCARTLLVLNVLGAAAQARFPRRSNADLLGKLHIGTDLHADYVGRDLVDFLDRYGEARLSRRLRGIVRRYRLQRSGKRFVRSLLGERTLARGREAFGRPALSKKVRIIDPDDLP